MIAADFQCASSISALPSAADSVGNLIATARQQALWAQIKLACAIEALCLDPSNAQSILEGAAECLHASMTAMRDANAVAMPTEGTA